MENESAKPGVVEEELPTPSTSLDYLSPFIVNYVSRNSFDGDSSMFYHLCIPYGLLILSRNFI